ncbi:glycoside hydrolase family 140 protein [Galbibacter mesophilus]|uniref:glycoside hydrolase family 140 protein n=1 Tax=Galbibacter mesophilus TaxID=379069 RepID=UPI00191D15B7|nr:glycoside hydrolase family 140 protein [Galbibacter mesophilus]MCM5663064.1 glycoside hydrolase family 140 protein [Galbibacter mesophilus]
MRLNTLLLLLLFSISLNSQEKQLPLLQVSENKMYLETTNGDPFFWLGDTAWELFHRLSKEEAIHYLNDRQQKGFTVVQAVILAELNGLTEPNANGDKPLIGLDPTKINEPYFAYVDEIIKEAEKRGIYIALLPTWGDKFNLAWGEGPEIFTPENAEVFGEILAKRYKDQNNLIWVLGGDRWPEDDEDREIIQGMAEGLLRFDKNHLITYHPNGGKKARDLFEKDWMDFDFFQSGHDRTAKDYKFVTESLQLEPKKPVINGEPRYENHPDRFKPEVYGWMDDSDVRTSAYWTFLAGGAGYTYGTHDIWQMFAPNRAPINKVRSYWKTALQLPGATHLGYVKKVFNFFPWHALEPDQSIILDENPEDETHIRAAKSLSEKFALVFTPFGKEIAIDVEKINPIFKAEKVETAWFNTRDGKLYAAKEFKATEGKMTFSPWSVGRGSDFLLIITTKSKMDAFKKYLEK